DYFDSSICWSDALEECLWGSDQLPPWRLDKDFRNPFVQMFYKRFLPRCLFVTCENDLCASAEPPLKLFRSEIEAAYLILMNDIVRRGEDIFMCVGLRNTPSNQQAYNFTSAPEKKVMAPVMITRPREWLRYVNIEQTHWPS